MSKRLNYYQVHKNKLPQKKKAKKFNFMHIKLALITANSVVQRSILMSQPISSIPEKTKLLAENVLNHTEAILSIYKEERKNRYLNRLRSHVRSS